MNNIVNVTFSDDLGNKRLERQPEISFYKGTTETAKSIIVDPSKTYQEWFGFGGIWTDTDIHNLMQLPKEEQDKILQAYFNPEKGMGWNLIRLPFGSTDWESSFDFYTYDDMPRGEEDLELEHFSIQRDIDRGMFELAKRCKAINPEVLFIGSVWGVPGWMKDNKSIVYGKFEKQYTKVYAKYLRKTIQAFKEQGIDLYAVTTQNETLISDDRATPACRFTWRLQKEVLIALKKELTEHQLTTKIWAFDDSYMRARIFVEPLLNDPEAKAVIDGVAYHSYNGTATEVSRITKMHPDIPSYHTERSLQTTNQFYSMVEGMHNSIKTHINWSILEDEYGGPNQFLSAGTPASLKPLQQRTSIYTYRDEPGKWDFAPGYGNYAQFTKYIKRGMKRIDSTFGDRRWVSTVSFLAEETKEIVTVVVNENLKEQEFCLKVGGKEVVCTIPAKTIATYCYNWDEEMQQEALVVPEEQDFGLEELKEWDMAVEEIVVEGTLVEGEAISFGCKIRNVGNMPTPRYANLRATFYLDGITDMIAIAMDNCELAPSESKVVKANIPVNKDIVWYAEKGYHDILVFLRIGGDIAPERNKANNCMGKEIYIAAKQG